MSDDDDDWIDEYTTLFIRVSEWIKQHQSIGQAFAPIMLHGARIAFLCGDSTQINHIKTLYTDFLYNHKEQTDEHILFCPLLDGFLESLNNSKSSSKSPIELYEMVFNSSV